MTEQINTPELRFPGFEDKWVYKDFDDCIKIKTKLVDPRLDKYQNLPHIGPANIEKNTGKILSYKLVKAENLVSGKFHFNENDIIYGKINPQLQKICLPQFEGLSSADAYPLSCLDVFNKFIYYSLFTQRFYKYSVSVSMRTGMPKINREELKNFKFVIPSYAEQKEIGDFFSKLDRQIELEEEKLELLEQQKKGYMQKIFSQELRFKDENGNSYPDWSIKKIEDISKVNKGFTPNTKNDEYWDELNENWLSIAGMTQKYLYKGNKGITEKGASKHVKVDKDTLIMSFKLTLGKLAIVKEPIYTNEAICHFVWKESNVNTEYMYYYLNSINISTFGAQAVKGVTLNNDSINSIIVKLPVIQEQNKIAYFFNKLDKLIEKQSSKVELLKQRKQGLLQKMFV